MVSDVARGSILELLGSAGHRGSFQQLLRETTPVPPPKPGHASPTQTQFTSSAVVEPLLFCQRTKSSPGEQQMNSTGKVAPGVIGLGDQYKTEHEPLKLFTLICPNTFKAR